MSLPIADLPLFAVGSAALLWVSRKPLGHPGSHGFWRFFAWEAILAVIVLNRDAEGGQFISQSLLLLSLFLLALALIALLRRGRTSARRQDAALYGWEKTTALVTDGIYACIRHPMYASLLALNWGMSFRALSLPGLLLATLASYFLVRTALAEEHECIAYFGEAYRRYMDRSWRFIPWLF